MYYNISMIKIKEPSVANTFYTGEAAELKQQLDGFSKENKNSYKYKTRAVIVPHAGLVYSGQLAYEGIYQLDSTVKNIFIFAPSHRVALGGLALSGYDEWKTPLGTIKINQEINAELEEKFGAKIFDEAFAEEHSVEIEVPAIQHLFNEVRIIPVLVGRTDPLKITEIISEYYDNKDFGFIISSDLSHFLDDKKAQKLDGETARMIESGNIQELRYEQACGALGIYGLVEFANKRKYSLIRINLINSSLTSGNKSSVVGYGAWFLYEGTKNKFIKEYYSEYLLNLCRNVILSKFNKDTLYTGHAPVFNQLGACFVTLKKNNNLRGCIGSIIAHQPLINDIVEHAKDAAFRDPRFNPVEQNEVDSLTIDISILSELQPMTFRDEQDLLEQIVPFRDGIIIKDKNRQAVYLPSVWEDLPDKAMFLNSLKIKAGLPPEHFSDTFEAYRFSTVYIEEK